MGWTVDTPLEASLAGVSVLVVDDDVETVELTEAMLRLCGATVRTARSATEALAVLAEWMPHLLLSDLEMPDGDGYHLAARVRSFPGSSGRVPVIAITGHGDDADRHRAQAAGFTALIVKPFDLGNLVSTLRTAEAGASNRLVN